MLYEVITSEAADDQEEVEVILRQAARIERIVGQLRSFSRSRGSRPEPLELAPLLDEIVEQIGHQSPLHGVTLERRYQAGIILHADGDQLRQVFANLVVITSYSIHYTKLYERLPGCASEAIPPAA